MLASVKTWAFAHLLSNGDLGSILLFGTFLAWAVYARIAAKRRTDLTPTTAPAGWTNDAIVVVLGIVVYLALGYVSIRSSSACRCSGVERMSVVQNDIRRLDRSRHPRAQRRRADRLPDLLPRAYGAHRSTHIATSSWSATRSAW